ncbi:MAG: hypothetical protein ACHQIM_01690 [Sphingobacteriales bacterium]
MEAKLNRNILEYHLNSITSRNGERLFETFAVKLAQLEICPNLRVQTGPVGGGDSKADSETYPISELTQLAFYEGIPNPNNDRWAFAISAKKTWSSKVASDVEGIKSTDRSYKRIFFITNQFARDKKRAEMEDTLSAEYNIEVTILDLNWILDRVFTNDRIKLAIDELQLDEGLEEVTIPGQLDIGRQRELNDINQLLDTAISKKEINHRIAKKALRAAILACELERPRTQVDGLFDRALRITTQIKSPELLFHIKYHQAWTAYFWFEDFELFVTLYDAVEELALDTHNIYIAERQNNLWLVFKTMSAGGYPSKAGLLETKTDNIRNLLTKFVINESRPSAGLQARALLTINSLLINADEPANVSKVFDELNVIFKDADMLIGFPYESIWTIVQELGSTFSNNPAYEKLLNDLVEIDMKRKGDVPAALSYMRFGIQQYKIGNHYKAIDYLGRSLAKLFKEESKDEFVSALYWLGNAYEKAGLLWAARGAWINAASFAISDYWLYNNINWMQSLCYSKLKFIELRLGRITQTLEWHELDYVISRQLAKTDEERKEVFKEAYYQYGMILGCLLIKTSTSQLQFIEKLPDILCKLYADFAAFAILYLLDGRTYLPVEFTKESDEELLETFSRWQDQPAQHSLADLPQFYTEPEVSLKSNILGGEFEIRTPTSSPAIELAETLLSALESFLSTTMDLKAIARMPRVTIRILPAENSDKLISSSSQIDLLGSFCVYYNSFNPHELTKEQNKAIGDSLLEIIAFITANTILFPDGVDSLKLLLTDQETYDRSFTFVRSMVTLGNVLGHDYKRTINDWFDEQTKIYPFKPDPRRKLRKADIKPDKKGEETINKEFVSHADMKLYTVINERVWTGAHWRGISYMGEASTTSFAPPVMVLIFADEKNGKQIFQLWKDEFGDKAGENVRISIVKGVDKKYPFWYTVTVGSNKQPKVVNKHFIIMTRLHTMNVDSHSNLNQFLNSFGRAKRFWLAPGYSPENSFSVDPFLDLGFMCSEITVRDAWEIGLNDLDTVAIVPGSEPVIPEHIKDAPVLQTLKAKSESLGKR